MALTIAAPPAANAVGPGFLVTVTGAAGPTALDDLLMVRVQTMAGGDLVQGTELYFGATFATVVLGVFQSDITPTIGMLAGAAAGAAVQLNAQRYDVSGALLEQTTTAGFVWDALNGLWVLSSLALGAGEAGGVAAILRSVRRTYSSP